MCVYIYLEFNMPFHVFAGTDSDPPAVHISRMLQILKEFSTDPILSSYVIDDVWDYMGAMKVCKCKYIMYVTYVVFFLDECS